LDSAIAEDKLLESPNHDNSRSCIERNPKGISGEIYQIDNDPVQFNDKIKANEKFSTGSYITADVDKSKLPQIHLMPFDSNTVKKLQLNTSRYPEDKRLTEKHAADESSNSIKIVQYGKRTASLKNNDVKTDQVDQQFKMQTSDNAPNNLLQCVPPKDHVSPVLANHKNVCEVCGKVCSSKSRLSDHVLTHTQSKPHKCMHCGRGFSHKANLKRHTRTHTDSKPFLCDLCGKSFIQKTSLVEHKAIHDAPKSHQCPQCDVTYNRVANLRLHISRVHGDPSELSKEAGKVKAALCHQCGKSFASSASLELHEKLHGGERQFRCTACAKSFVLKAQHEMHMRTHAGHKPYVCAICDKAFVHRNGLQQHCRIHLDVKPCLCTVCGNRYAQGHHLKAHMLTHTGNKPFKCGACSKEYRNGVDLKIHCRRVHGTVVSG
jgi:uncharacterized Zn-finger protein